MEHTRHMDLFNCSQQSITLVGAGGIGAAAAMALAKMGVGFLAIYDGDVVAPENLATQLHKVSDVGLEKAEAVQGLIFDFADDVESQAISHRVDEDTQLYGNIVVSAVDSITARKQIWEAVKKSQANWYIDARMAAEEFQMYCIDRSDPKAVEWYEGFITSINEADVPELACTAKATIFTAFSAAGHIGEAVKTITIGDVPPRIVIHNIRTFTLTKI